MANEEAILKDLTGRFAFLEGKGRVARARRIFVEVPAEKWAEVFDYAVTQAGFTILCTITGLDLGESFGAIYHLSKVEGEVLNLQVNIPKAKPELQTIIGYFPAAELYERELVDLLGVQILGLPPGHRYPLPDDFPQGLYPLRKDFKAEMLDAPSPERQAK